MRKLNLLLILFLFLIGGATYSLDFEITDVIEVSLTSEGHLLTPAKWSPDGSMLAYFFSEALYISDTLGNSRKIIDIDMQPRRFEWVSNNEIALRQRQFRENHDLYQVVKRIDIDSEKESILAEALINTALPLEELNNQLELDKLKKTVGGTVYFSQKTGTTKTFNLVESTEALKNDGKTRASEEHFLRTGTDALYLVQIDQQDSIKISNKPYEGYMGLPMNLSSDRKYIMFGGNIVRLADDKLIILDTLSAVLDKPEGTFGCGFGSESFNPAASEVAFRLTCDDGHSVVVRRIGVFDYSTNEFTILDSVLGLSNCNRPAFSPDGKRISFISNGVLYIMVREILK
ncbi:MAG: hypothetical protein GY865_14220 [candidate division Zixibacteria bacterium]|nr:hypothetical protein [candidate division Zixibacteria bacterium]